jgi:hypothetical protein
MNKFPAKHPFLTGESGRGAAGTPHSTSNKDAGSIKDIDKIVNIPGDDDKVLIECPGATLYRDGGNEVAAGVKFCDEDDPVQGYEIVDRPVFGPHHVKYRWVKKQDLHLIRRCHSCQDYTVRMRRKEGPDLYIPSRKNPISYHHSQGTKKPADDIPNSPSD